MLSINNLADCFAVQISSNVIGSWQIRSLAWQLIITRFVSPLLIRFESELNSVKQRYLLKKIKIPIHHPRPEPCTNTPTTPSPIRNSFAICQSSRMSNRFQWTKRNHIGTRLVLSCFSASHRPHNQTRTDNVYGKQFNRASLTDRAKRATDATWMHTTNRVRLKTSAGKTLRNQRNAWISCNWVERYAELNCLRSMAESDSGKLTKRKETTRWQRIQLTAQERMRWLDLYRQSSHHYEPIWRCPYTKYMEAIARDTDNRCVFGLLSIFSRLLIRWWRNTLNKNFILISQLNLYFQSSRMKNKTVVDVRVPLWLETTQKEKKIEKKKRKKKEKNGKPKRGEEEETDRQPTKQKENQRRYLTKSQSNRIELKGKFNGKTCEYRIVYFADLWFRINRIQ